MEKNKLIFIAIIFATTLALVFIFVFPKYQESVALQNNLTKKQIEYSGKSAYYAEVSKVVDDIDGKKDSLQKIDNALPTDFSFAPLINFFQKKGSEAGLTVQSMVFSQISSASQIPTLRNVIFKINVSGSYQNFKKFLVSLDRSERLFEVNSISFSPAVISNAPTGLDSIINNNTVSNTKIQQNTYSFQLEIQTNTY